VLPLFSSLGFDLRIRESTGSRLFVIDDDEDDDDDDDNDDRDHDDDDDDDCAAKAYFYCPTMN
jgi:hypothetical protein